MNIQIDNLDKELYGQDLLAIYGPYSRAADIRKHVILYNGKYRTTLSYPKYLVERKIGRKLFYDETVDHIDNYEGNDDINNLQVLTRANNIRKFASKYSELIDCDLESCPNKFRRKYKKQKYCSNICRYISRRR